MVKHQDSAAEFLLTLPNLPLPNYPFPELASPFLEPLQQECNNWIDDYYHFLSLNARTKYKQHVLTNIAARAFPFINSLDDLRPIGRWTFVAATLDDYLDNCSKREYDEINKKIEGILSGASIIKDDAPAFYRVWALIREDAIRCGMPAHIYEKCVIRMNAVTRQYRDEKHYISANRPPPLAVYLVLREETSGVMPYCKYLCMQQDFRNLPDTVLENATILRLHALASILVGLHNDFISLPKELLRKGDVINIVKVMQQEYDTTWSEAYNMAMSLHDHYVQDFLTLQANLPDFDEWQQTAEAYVRALGIMIHGIYIWHAKDTPRYRPGVYVEPEFSSKEWEWKTEQ